MHYPETPNWNNGTFNSAFANNAGVNFHNSYVPSGPNDAGINNKISNQVDTNSINKRN